MTHTTPNSKFIALALTTALATSTLGGCATQAAPQANISASKAQVALAKGQTDKALTHAEAAVLADPQNAGYRAMLGATYMEEGRFQSAATSFGDAMALGDTSPRTALSLALAQTAAGDTRSARTVLNDYRDDIDPADLGLALALAGDANQGVHILSNAIRGGQNNAKVRQNLAYAYALQGDWQRARLMAAEDVPADQVSNRIAQWAALAAPEYSQARVAALLEVPVVADSGQPAQLALLNNPGPAQMAAEAATELPASNPAPAFASASTRELPPLAPLATSASVAPAPAPATAPASFRQAFAQTAPATIARPVVQQVPARTATVPATASTKPAAAVAAKGGDHMIQLGSFSSKESAQRAISVYSKRYAKLSAYDMTISEARVNGKTYWRVAAGNMPRFDASKMCSNVKARGYGCIAYASAKPLPGAVDSGVRMARR